MKTEKVVMVRESTYRDLMKALRTISDLEFAGSCCGCSTDDAFDEAQKVAREALTKAEGRT